MSANTVNYQLALAEAKIPDPGNGKTISIEKSLSTCDLVSVGEAETRTMANPPKAGVIVTLLHYGDGGDITVNFDTAFTQEGASTFVFSEAGQWLTLISIRVSATALAWRKLSDYSIANLSPGDASILASFSALTATVAEINQVADQAGSVEVLTVTRVLTAADSGKTLFLASATEFDTKLPAPALGLRLTFIVGLAPSGANYTITTNGSAQNVIHGVVSSAEDALGAGAGTNGTPVDVVTFVAAKSMVGDRVHLICDGTLWYLHGVCYQQDAITLS